MGTGELMNRGPEVRVFKAAARIRELNVFVDLEQNGHYYAGEPIVMKERTEVNMSSVDAPVTTLSPTAAQQLIDDLWDCGLRPSEGTGSAGAMAATQKHLEDMRKLVFEGKK